MGVRSERVRVRKLKTEAYRNNHCLKYMRGFCEEGSRCRWVHPELDVAPWIRDQGMVVEQPGEEDEGDRVLVVDSAEWLMEDNDNMLNDKPSEWDEGEVEGAVAMAPETPDLEKDPDYILEWIQKQREELGKRDG